MSDRTGAERIADERRRQIVEEGYGSKHDAGHHDELALAAATYALPRRFLILTPREDGAPWPWPWAPGYYRPSADRVRELEKAGALIAAAIDALTAGNVPSE